MSRLRGSTQKNWVWPVCWIYYIYYCHVFLYAFVSIKSCRFTKYIITKYYVVYLFKISTSIRRYSLVVFPSWYTLVYNFVTVILSAIKNILLNDSFNFYWWKICDNIKKTWRYRYVEHLNRIRYYVRKVY